MKLRADLIIAAALLLAGSIYATVAHYRPPSSLSGPVPAYEAAPDYDDWVAFGGDEGSSRYVPLDQINRNNVRYLQPAWTYRTGHLEGAGKSRFSFQVTPVMAAGNLVFCTPFNKVVALDPETGAERWAFDPEVERDVEYGNAYTCRGVSQWVDAKAPADTQCQHRIFAITVDRRLFALDARTGAQCSGFNGGKAVSVNPGMDLVWPGEFQITSPPAIVGDVVVVGSAISDNVRVQAPRGTIRAFDARSGKVVWTFDPIPRNLRSAVRGDWPDNYQAGHANVWTTMSVDEELGLVYLPTSSPSPDFWGGLRAGDNRYANSVIAVDGKTGKVVWHFQTVHHDVWDYDLPAAPSLLDLPVDGVMRKLLIQPSKQGFLFVLDRETGEPIFDIQEMPVPAGVIAGEPLSPTQPMPRHVPALVKHEISADDAFGFTPFDEGACRDVMEAAGPSVLYTPPDEDGTLLFPFNGGGVNWGGVSVSPDGVVYANVSNAVHLVRLFRKETGATDKAAVTVESQETAGMVGAPFALTRDVLLSPLGVPCNQPPWGELKAVDLRAGQILWEKSIGTTRQLAGPISLPLGSPTLGGSLITKSGLLFIGASVDGYLRAYDARTGEELWGGDLPTAAMAGPMSYAVNGKQYVVIAAGGHRDLPVAWSDHVIAYALPGKPGESSEKTPGTGEDPRRHNTD